MPLFEYSCAQCGFLFEELVFTSGLTIACPQCGSPQVEKQLSTFGVAHAASLPCGEGACPMPESPACGEGACPGCAN
ncbi:MAG: zinc ribbon domain-containing protein [Candidatus Omnitrophica bacterium]|nr:zinc ribbon domain-containing protein [Candidatus Omnitrophota bacterium]